MTRKRARPESAKTPVDKQSPETPVVDQAPKQGRLGFLKDSRLGNLCSLIAVIPVIAGILSSMSSYFGPARLSLTYTSKYRLSQREDNLPAKLRLSYADQQVERLFVLTGEIQNTGTQSIEASDIDMQPIFQVEDLRTFHFSRVLDAFVLGQSPGSSVASCSFDESAVRFKMKLINGKERIRFQVVCEGDPGWPMLEYHIRGIGEPRTYRVPRERYEGTFGTVLGLCFMTFMGIWGLLIFTYVMNTVFRVVGYLQLYNGPTKGILRHLRGAFVLVLLFVLIAWFGWWYFDAIYLVRVRPWSL